MRIGFFLTQSKQVCPARQDPFLSLFYSISVNYEIIHFHSTLAVPFHWDFCFYGVHRTSHTCSPWLETGSGFQRRGRCHSPLNHACSTYRCWLGCSLVVFSSIFLPLKRTAKYHQSRSLTSRHYSPYVLLFCWNLLAILWYEHTHCTPDPYLLISSTKYPHSKQCPDGFDDFCRTVKWFPPYYRGRPTFLDERTNKFFLLSTGDSFSATIWMSRCRNSPVCVMCDSVF